MYGFTDVGLLQAVKHLGAIAAAKLCFRRLHDFIAKTRTQTEDRHRLRPLNVERAQTSRVILKRSTFRVDIIAPQRIPNAANGRREPILKHNSFYSSSCPPSLRGPLACKSNNTDCESNYPAGTLSIVFGEGAYSTARTTKTWYRQVT